MAAETTAAPPTLVVHASHVPGGGWGLFTTAPIPAGTEVVEYRGTPLRTAAAVAAGRDKAYLMRLGPQAYTDGREHAGMLARYMNDARAVRYNNVYFDKRPEAGCAVAIALRDIDAGEELLVSYGKWYWMKVPGAVLAPPDGWPTGTPWPPRLAPPELGSQHEAALAAVAAALSAAAPQNCESATLPPSQLPPAVLPSSNVSA